MNNEHVNNEQTSILESLTDEERQRAEAFVREDRAAQARERTGKALVGDHIARGNERAASKENPLDGPRHYPTARG